MTDTTPGKDTGLAIEVATDENGLTDCGCGANELAWLSKSESLADEADHTLEEAMEIDASALPWKRIRPGNTRFQKLFDQEAGPDSWDEWRIREVSRAAQNGLAAHCAKCYAPMSPTMATAELADGGRP